MPGLTHLEKLVLVAFGDSADADTGLAYPSYKKMGKRIHIQRTSIIRAARELVKKGCLTKGSQVHRDGSSANNAYIVLPDGMTAPVGWDEAAAAAGVTDEDIADFEADDDAEIGGVTIAPGSVTMTPPQCHHDTTVVSPCDPVKGYITNQLTTPLTPHDDDDGPTFVTGPADWEGFAADIRTAAGTALGDRIEYPSALIALVNDPAEAATAEDVLAAVRSARDWCLDKHGPGKMWSWKLVLMKAPEVAARRQANEARQAQVAGDGRARQGQSGQPSSRPKGGGKPKAAPVEAAPIPEWSGPADVRRAVVAALGDGGARSCLDPAEWDADANVIGARSNYAYDKLRQVRGISAYRVELRPREGRVA